MRLYVVWCVFVFVGMASSVALAGDPCPIDLVVYEAGSPGWLNNTELLRGLASKDSWVGISFRSRTSLQGVEITAVSPKSPASRAGLLVGDRIVAVGGDRLQGGHRAFAALFRKSAPNTTLLLTVVRGEVSFGVTLTLGGQDPFVGKLIDVASAQECRSVRRGFLDSARRAKVLGAVFRGSISESAGVPRRFACSKAHEKLRKVGGLDDGAVVVVRGSKRLLISNVGWSTICVHAADYDGDALTDARVQKLLKSVTRAYVRDRYDNP